MASVKKKFESFDHALIAGTRRWHMPFARFAIFLVYFWFGILKVFAESPANPLVAALLERTLPFMSFHTFIVLFGIFEMIIGIAFLASGLERLAILLLVIHLVTTVMPLFVLPAVTWQHAFVPTLEGQYIIKNILIIALAIVIAARLRSWREARTAANA